ncbi:MAG: 6-bladed beta-propeller [Candidatus Aminicenantes bacterium]|nr:6-bladed beta-propeller [Candidatus Aminicenantes bacterium]
MKKIRKFILFKFFTWLLVVLFVFQGDALLSVKNNKNESNAQKQLKMAEKELKKGDLSDAKRRVERLLSLCTKEDNKQLFKSAQKLLREIEDKIREKELPPKPEKPDDRVIVKNGKKKKKFPWLLAIGAVVVGVGVYLIIKDGDKPPSPPNFHIVSVPTSAVIYVDGVNMGKTPRDVYVIPGPHDFKVRLPNYGAAELTFSIEESVKYDVAVTLSSYRYIFDTKWGSPGSVDKKFKYPYGIAVDRSSTVYVYVVDRENHRLQKFDTQGKYISKWGAWGYASKQFIFPQGVAVNWDSSDIHLYVADTENERIQKFSSNGQFELMWTNGGKFQMPNGVAVNNNDFVYVTDKERNRVQKFTKNGDLQVSWGSEILNAPCGVATDSNKDVYVASSENHRIVKFTSNGTRIYELGGKGTGNGKFDLPWGVATDDYDCVYVTDKGNNRVQKFTSNGSFLTKWGSKGSGNNQFYSPRGIAVDKNFFVYIADSDNHRIMKFKMSDISEGNGIWDVKTSNITSAGMKLSSGKSLVLPGLKEKRSKETLPMEKK